MTALSPIQTEAREVFGVVTEDNDRIYALEETPWYSPNAHFPVTLRCWGKGHWVRCDGQAAHYPNEAAAHAAGRRWIETGRTA